MSNKSKILSEDRFQQAYGEHNIWKLMRHDAALRAQRDELLALVEQVANENARHNRCVGCAEFIEPARALITRIKGE